MGKRKKPSRAKAAEMLHHGKVHGKKLTKKQRGLFGAVAAGKSKKKPGQSRQY